MSRKVTVNDPRKGYSRDQIKAICKAYMTPNLPVADAARKFGISRDRLRAIVKLEGCKLRGREFALRQSARRGKRTIAHVFGGMAGTGLSTTGRTLAGDEFQRRKAELEERERATR